MTRAEIDPESSHPSSLWPPSSSVRLKRIRAFDQDHVVPAAGGLRVAQALDHLSHPLNKPVRVESIEAISA